MISCYVERVRESAFRLVVFQLIVSRGSRWLYECLLPEMSAFLYVTLVFRIFETDLANQRSLITDQIRRARCRLIDFDDHIRSINSEQITMSASCHEYPVDAIHWMVYSVSLRIVMKKNGRSVKSEILPTQPTLED